MDTNVFTALAEMGEFRIMDFRPRSRYSPSTYISVVDHLELIKHGIGNMLRAGFEAGDEHEDAESAVCNQRISRLEAAFDNALEAFRMYAVARAVPI